MARDFHDADADARRTFEEASEALSLDVAALCFEDGDRLDLTELAQPAIVTAEIAMFRYLSSRGALEPRSFGGHSLGEYTALVAAGVMPLGETVRLVRERGRLMQEAVPVGVGGMTAIVAVGRDVELDVAAVTAAAAAAGVDVANHNARDQIVLSGLLEDLEAACESVKKLPGLERVRAISLNVSAPFHSRHMKPVEQALEPVLRARAGDWSVAAAARVTSNFDGGFHVPEADALVSSLCRQAGSPVRWLDNMRVLRAEAERIVEVGPGKPLSTFFKREGVTVQTVTDLAGAERLIAG